MRIITIFLLIIFLHPSNVQSKINHKVENQISKKFLIEAMETFAKGQYNKTIKLLEKINCKFPLFRYDAVAHIKTADAYYKLGKYTTAINMYNHFMQTYPRSKSIPYVIHHIAHAYLNQIENKKTSQFHTKTVINLYNKYITKFSENKYKHITKKNIILCYKKLSEYELTIGKSYYNKKKFDSALSRFLDIILLYPDMGYHHKTLLYIGKYKYIFKIK